MCDVCDFSIWESHSVKHCAHLNVVYWAQVSTEEGANDQHHCCSSAQILEEEVLHHGGQEVYACLAVSTEKGQWGMTLPTQQNNLGVFAGAASCSH